MNRKNINVRFSENVGVEIDEGNDIRLDINDGTRHVYLDATAARSLAKALKKAAKSVDCDACDCKR